MINENEEKKQFDKHGHELIDPAKAAKLMEESYLEGISHVRNASRELFETYAVNPKLSEDFKSGMALICHAIEKLSDDAVETEFINTIAKDYLEKARVRAINQLRVPFYKPKTKGKVSL